MIAFWLYIEKSYFGQLAKNVFLSFFADKKGFSGRKLSAFIAILIAQFITIKYTNILNVEEMVIIWLCFALLCLGIVTIEQVIALKNGKKEEPVKSDEPIDTPN